MKNIIIRTLGGKSIGYGHYFRCLSLAKAIKLVDKNINVVFLVNRELADQIKATNFKFIINNDFKGDTKIIENSGASLFIFDSYLGNNAYLKNIKQKTGLMLIDDNNDIYNSSIPDIIYNGNIHAETLGYKYVEGQLRLLGSKYLIMKEQYWNDEPSLLLKDGVLVTTGGTDEYKVTLNIIDIIKKLDIKTRLIIGPGYNDGYIEEIKKIKTENIELIYKPSSLKQYINSSKIVITAGGSTVYEVLSQKSIPIVFSIADNQDLICKALQQMGIPYLGKYPDIHYSKLGELIEKLQNKEIDERKKIFNLIDGKGAVTTANILMGKRYSF